MTAPRGAGDAADQVHVVTVGDLQLAYLADGPKDGPLVVCVHGFPDTAHTWQDLLPALADAGYRAVAPFQRGYAPSEAPSDGEYGALALGEDLLGLITALGRERAVLIGHDWGASAVLAATARAPERVTRLVVLAIPHPGSLRPTPRLLWKARHFFTFQFRRRATRRLKARGGAFVDTIVRRWSPTWDYPPEETAAFKAMLQVPGAAEAALGYYWSARADARGPRRRALKASLGTKITVPTLALLGLDDPIVGPAHFERARRCFEGPYRWEGIAGAGHFIQRERPAEVEAAVLGFLAEEL